MKTMSGNLALTSLSRAFIITLVLSLLAFAPSAKAATGNQKTGVVDVGKVLDQMPEKKKAENILKSTGTQWEKSLDTMKCVQT